MSAGRCLRRHRVKLDESGWLQAGFYGVDAADVGDRFARYLLGPSRVIVDIVEEADPTPPFGIVRPVTP